jgi:CheY-like chemotaxis protein
MIEPLEGWYYRVGAKVIGPVSRRHLRERLAAGVLRSRTFIWRGRSPSGELLHPCRVYRVLQGKRLITVLVGAPGGPAEALRPLLRRWGHDARLARPGKEAARAAQLCQPDAVFLDLDEAGVDVHQLAAEMRDGTAGRPPVLIALMRGLPEEEPQGPGQEVFRHYLEKPIDPNVLALVLALVRQERGDV